MALEQRIESLRKRHADIDLRIRAETARPMPDDLLVHQLKTEKVYLKDDINHLMMMTGQREAA